MSHRQRQPGSDATFDHRALSISATVDWVEIKVTLRAATNPQTIHAWTLKHWRTEPFVTPINGLRNRTARVFTFRIQDPASANTVAAMLQDFAGRFPMAEPPEVIGVEAALDARPKCPATTPAALAAATEHFFQHHAGLVADWRVAGAEGTVGEVTRPLKRRELQSLVKAGKTIFVGHKDADLTQRFYFKTTDDGRRVQLPPHDQRARCEVTLSKGQVPFRTIDEWRRFDFASLAPFFKFRRVKEAVTPIVANIRAEFVRPEASPHRNAYLHSAVQRKRRGRKSSTNTVADIDLNKRAHDALRALTTKQGRSAKISGPRRSQAVDFTGANGIAVNTLINTSTPTSCPDSKEFEHWNVEGKVLEKIRDRDGGRFVLRDVFHNADPYTKPAPSGSWLSLPSQGVPERCQPFRACELRDLRQSEVQFFDSS